jgi:hypothetical protein
MACDVFLINRRTTVSLPTAFLDMFQLSNVKSKSSLFSLIYFYLICNTLLHSYIARQLYLDSAKVTAQNRINLIIHKISRLKDKICISAGFGQSERRLVGSTCGVDQCRHKFNVFFKYKLMLVVRQ